MFPPTFTLHRKHLRPSSLSCPTHLKPDLLLRYKTLHKTTGNSWLYAFSSVQDIESESGIQGSLLQASNPTPCDLRALRAYNLRRVDIQAPFFRQIYQVYILNRFEVERILSLPVPTYRKSFSLSLQGMLTYLPLLASLLVKLRQEIGSFRASHSSSTSRGSVRSEYNNINIARGQSIPLIGIFGISRRFFARRNSKYLPTFDFQSSSS